MSFFKDDPIGIFRIPRAFNQSKPGCPVLPPCRRRMDTSRWNQWEEPTSIPTTPGGGVINQNEWEWRSPLILKPGGIWMFPKIVGFPPKSSILIGFSIINHPFRGTLIFGNTQRSKGKLTPFLLKYQQVYTV